MDNLQYDRWLSVYKIFFGGFKPYYKWIIFNIQKDFDTPSNAPFTVLNLIING